MAKIGVFKDTDFKNYIGVAPFRIVEDEDGTPIVNPTREVLSKYINSIPSDGDAILYNRPIKLEKGFTDLGGREIISEKEMEERMGGDDLIAGIDTTATTVRFLCTTFIEDTKIEQGSKVVTKLPLYFLLDFKWYAGSIFVNKGNTSKCVYNKFGQSAWINENNEASLKGEMSSVLGEGLSYFNAESTEDIFNVPRSLGSLGFKELIEFVNAYFKLNPSSKDNIIFDTDDVDLTKIDNGELDEFINLITELHQHRTVNKAKQYGANVLLTVNTRGENPRQEFYNTFDSAVLKADGTLSTKFNRIKNAIIKSREPKGGVSYSPEASNLMVAHTFGGLPGYGLKVVKQASIDTFTMRANGSAPTNEVKMPGTNDESFADDFAEVDDNDF